MTSSLSEEGRHFLQKRTARFGLVVGGLGMLFWVIRAITGVLADVPSALFGPSMVPHLVGALSMVLLFVVNARGDRPALFIQWSEIFLITVSCLAYGEMATTIPLVFRPEATLTLIYATLLLGRAIYVPGKWRWTAGLGFLIGLELGWITWMNWREVSPAMSAALSDAGTLGPARSGVLINTLTWWVVITILAAAASQVIYGLRRAVGKARQLGQYTLVRKIGEGGVGMVYEARHMMLRRPTAVKLMQPEKIDEASIKRFEREVRATAALQHPNTVTVFDYGRTPDGVFYYAMELVAGGTLTRVVELGGPMPPERVLALLYQIASGLAGAHEAGLIHRDVKPDNVLLSPVPGYGEVAKLVDFGLVLADTGDPSITREGSIVGTPQYLAPETIHGDKADPRSDLYALGGVGFFLLVGEHVFTAKTIVEVCSMHLMQAPDSPSERRGEALPDGLDELILRLLAKDPADRFASAADVQAALEKVEGFGRWTPGRARRWWADFGSDLEHLEASDDGASDTHTIGIDLGRRT